MSCNLSRSFRFPLLALELGSYFCAVRIYFCRPMSNKYLVSHNYTFWKLEWSRCAMCGYDASRINIGNVLSMTSLEKPIFILPVNRMFSGPAFSTQHELDISFQERGQKGPNMTTISSRYQVCILTRYAMHAMSCRVQECGCSLWPGVLEARRGPGLWQEVACCTVYCCLYCTAIARRKSPPGPSAWCQESGEERELLQFSSERALEAWGSPTKLRDKTQLQVNSEENRVTIF